MKIALISHLFPTKLHPSQGKFIRDQAELMGHDSEIDLSIFVPTPISVPFTNRYKSNVSRFATTEVIPKRVSYFSIPAKKFPFITQFFLVRSFRNLLFKEKPDCVHVHFLYPGGLLIPMLNKWGLKTILTVHGGDWYKCINLPYFDRIIDKIIQNSEKILVVGPQLKDEFQNKYESQKHKFLQINNHINEDIYTIPSITKKNQLKDDFGWDKDKLHFLCVGNNRPEKGIDILVDAIKLLSSYKDKVEFHVVGNLNDSFSEKVIKVDSSFTHHSPVSPEKLIEYYQASDAYLLPSRNEGFGLAMIEAASCGLPIVGNPTGIAKTFITPEIGILNTDFSSTNFSKSIVMLMNKISNYDSIKIRSKVINYFGNQVFKSSLKKIYRETYRKDTR